MLTLLISGFDILRLLLMLCNADNNKVFCYLICNKVISCHSPSLKYWHTVSNKHSENTPQILCITLYMFQARTWISIGYCYVCVYMIEVWEPVADCTDNRLDVPFEKSWFRVWWNGSLYCGCLNSRRSLEVDTSNKVTQLHHNINKVVRNTALKF